MNEIENRNKCIFMEDETDKKEKDEKNLLKQFEYFSNEMLLNLIKRNFPKYILLVKSEQKAIDFMKSRGINSFPILNKIIKERTEKLVEIAKQRSITIPDELYLVEISTDDIIARIQQFKQEEIHWIKKHSYFYDLTDSDYDTNDIMNLTTANCTTEQAIRKIESYYNFLINSYRICQESSQENLIDLVNKKKWNSKLWKPVGVKQVKIDDINLGQCSDEFVPYQAPDERYEVRGAMPSSKNKTLELNPPIRTKIDNKN